ncbi:2-succinyl-6-hydroxy-2,4-cyclohexadiene-1-carboxylate synthase [Sporolactobacillus kofuensis]|uniref:Putative 2-succinyl-6-hydroxy-2,4-cyclohexadiene-1-carboxylate synthase n=1 Tax=Sporolactobacillus kofuensis TaxID=269672 RepID=A0ABW1WEZ5_9BACL|nr:2-succinyl-6-hydroxy-2,4-cyclohexadiene-1-carboxylate synthase [Sporolactobacillus kofuensis]MCO7176218.1 2-succinyl-6-hydroxy-2,4-cyclohexadiene-1-carboxylate synthase [Sporolactobacillus kofuensis]
MKAQIRGVSYHYELKGSGEPLLLLHGFTGSMDTWRFMEHVFANEYQLILVDIIGHGKTESPGDPKRYAMNEAARDLCNLLDLLTIEKVHVLGYSMGGRLALSFSCLFPNRVMSLTLESSSPGLRTEKERHERRLNDQRLAISIRENGMQKFVNHWESIALFESQKQLPEEKRMALRNQRLANKEQALACSLLGMGTGAQPSWWEHLPLLTMPVLLITGEWDHKFCSIASEMTRLLPDSEWEIIPHSGHAVHLERADEYQEIIRSFIKEQKEKHTWN